MKSRRGFISNSSTTSFICDVCGENYSERDASLADAQMFECKNGHTVCDRHMVNEEKFAESENTDTYQVDIEYCPLCQMTMIEGNDLRKYLLCKSAFKSTEEAEAAIKAEFSNYDVFQAFLKTKV